MLPKKQYYENLASSVIKQFNKRGIEGYYCESADDAVSTITRMLTPGCTIACGGSMTLQELGLPDIFRNSDYTFYERPTTKDAFKAYYSNVVTSDYFFMSSNAVTFDGLLVNIDGSGNRVAPMIFGPSNVMIVVGMNKLVPTLDDAYNRVRNVAAPPNCIRLNKNTPCALTGKCADCQSPDCICSNTVVTRRSAISGRIKVFLIGEELGY